MSGYGIPKHLQRITGGLGDKFIDEVVLCGVDVHLERMSDGAVWMAFYRPDSEVRLSVWFYAERKHDVVVTAHWDGHLSDGPWSDVQHEVREYPHKWPDGSEPK